MDIRGHLGGMGSLFQLLGPSYWTQVVRLGSECLNPWSHLVGSAYRIFLSCLLTLYFCVCHICMCTCLWVYMWVSGLLSTCFVVVVVWDSVFRWTWGFLLQRDWLYTMLQESPCSLQPPQGLYATMPTLLFIWILGIWTWVLVLV